MKASTKLIALTGLIVFFPLLIESCKHQEVSSDKNKIELSGPYLGQELPADSAKLFAPGIISTGYYERDLSISPDGKELFFGITVGNINTFLHMKQVNGIWTKPAVPEFGKERKFIIYEPCFSPDGKKLYFLSTRPTEGEKEIPGFVNQNIFAVDKLDNGNWSEPYDVGKPINTLDGEFFPSIAKSGNMYFTRSYAETGKSFIYKSDWENEAFTDPVLLPENVNMDGSIFNACISPDESYLIANASGREEGKPANAFYYYIFFNLGDGQWTNAINLGDKVNLPNSRSMAQSVSPDGKYLFFSSTFAPEVRDEELNTDDIYNFYQDPQNGSMDIYWISTDFIEKLKKQYIN